MAAQQVALGLVNTSVDVRPTSTKNKYKLETDPALQASPAAPADPSQYIPYEGELNNHFDPTQFELATDPNTGTFALGASVAGEGPFQVVGFYVQTVDGGLVDVQDNGKGGESVTELTSGPLDPTDGPVGGGESGNVYDIHFKIISQDRSQVLSSDQDQNFYELFLNQIGNNPPGYDTTFPNQDSFIDFTPIDPNSGLPDETVGPAGIIASATPEVSSAGFLAVGGLAIFFRRRRAKKNELLPLADAVPV